MLVFSVDKTVTFFNPVVGVGPRRGRIETSQLCYLTHLRTPLAQSSLSGLLFLGAVSAGHPSPGKHLWLHRIPHGVRIRGPGPQATGRSDSLRQNL